MIRRSRDATGQGAVLVLGASAGRARRWPWRTGGSPVNHMPIGGDGPAGRLASVRSAIAADVARGVRPRAIVDDGSGGDALSAAALLALYWALPAGGRYVIDGVEEDGEVSRLLAGVSTLAGTADDHLSKVPAAERDLADSTRSMKRRGRRVVLTKARHHRVKLRDRDADTALTDVFGPSWGEVLAVHEAHTWTPASTVHVHGEGGPKLAVQPIAVPERSLRRYDGVSWHGRQVFAKGELWLPDTFRHQSQRVLSQRALVRSSQEMGRLKSRMEPRATRRVQGTFYNFDTEFPGHFGHVTTEVLSRYWGWQEARRRYPSIRPLVSTYHRSDQVPGFQLQMLQALGVPTDEILTTYRGRELVLEHLVSASPDFENPVYADPALAEVWAALYAGLPADDPDAPRPDRVFVSRRPGGARYCLQTPEIERWFVDRGFAVVYPEDLPYARQAHLFAGARVIAGFGGSGLFNMMFAPSARIVLISGTSYTARNEYLFGAVNGNEMHYFWGESELRAVKGFDLDAYKSPFSFDLPRFASELEAAIA
jgi:capsular polysaccharide biosynthesis protein